MVSLLTEYKCKVMMLCGIVPVRNEQFEKNFHRLLTARFPHLVCNMTIGNVEKDELYLCDRSLLNEFFALTEVPYQSPQQIELQLSKEKTEQLKLQLEILRMQQAMQQTMQ